VNGIIERVERSNERKEKHTEKHIVNKTSNQLKTQKTKGHTSDLFHFLGGRRKRASARLEPRCLQPLPLPLRRVDCRLSRRVVLFVYRPRSYGSFLAQSNYIVHHTVVLVRFTGTSLLGQPEQGCPWPGKAMLCKSRIRRYQMTRGYF
jgi:hypothetical protein